MNSSAFRIESVGFTSLCLRAYLASMKPVSKTSATAADPAYRRGRSAIERLARSAQGSDAPTLQLTAAERDDVLRFMKMSEPITPANWWKEPRGVANHVSGFHTLLHALAHSQP